MLPHELALFLLECHTGASREELGRKLGGQGSALERFLTEMHGNSKLVGGEPAVTVDISKLPDVPKGLVRDVGGHES